MPPRRGAGGQLLGTADPAQLSAPTPGHIAWPHHDPGAGIPPSPPPVKSVPPVRWPQGDIDWLTLIGEVPADPVGLPPAGAGGLIETGQLILFGGSVQNTGTAAATLTLYDGADAKGTPIAVHVIAAGTDRQITLPRAGVLCEIGLFCTVTGATVTGTVYLGHIWKYPFTPPGE